MVASRTPSKQSVAESRRNDSRRSSLAEVEKTCIADEDLKHIFDSFDYDKSGSIDERELHQAMKMLGVTCSLNTAKKILKQIDSNSNGLVEWDEFQAFFGRVGDPEDIKKMLSMQNQRFFEYKHAVTTDFNFARTFAIPPSKDAACKLLGHTDAVESVFWLSDSTVVSGSIDGQICLWDMGLQRGDKASMTSSFKTSSGPGAPALYSMTTSPDACRIAVGLDFKDSPNIRTYDIQTGEQFMEHEGHTSAVYGCAYASDASVLCSGGKNGMLCLHDPTRQTSMQKVEDAHMSVVHSVDFQSDGHVLCTASKDGTIKIFDARCHLKGDKPEALVDDAAASGTVMQALWRNNDEIVSCGDDYCIRRWDLRDLSDGPVASYFGHTDVVRTIAISSDGNYLASGTHSGSVRIWHMDELGVLESANSALQERVAALEVEVERNMEKYQDGLVDVEKMREVQAALDACKADAERVDKSCKQAQYKGYSEAALSCDGFKLPVASMAWSGSNPGRLAVGCQDQSVRLFHLDVPSVL